MSGIAAGDHAAMTWNPACGAWDFGSGCYCHNRSKRPTSQNIEAPTFLTRTPVEPSRVRIGLFPDMLGRYGRQHPVRFDVRVDPGPDGGAVLAGTVGSRTAPMNAVLSLVFIAVFAGLALSSLVIGVVIAASGHFNLGVGAAIGSL